MCSVTLDDAMRRLNLSDADLAQELGVHRTQVWAWKTGRYVPDSANALRLIDGLKKHGVEIDLSDLLPKKRKRSRSA